MVGPPNFCADTNSGPQVPWDKKPKRKARMTPKPMSADTMVERLTMLANLEGGGPVADALDEAADLIERLEAEKRMLVERLNALQQAEATYRYSHDVLGAGDSKTGRAWDLMRRAGDEARSALERTQ